MMENNNEKVKNAKHSKKENKKHNEELEKIKNDYALLNEKLLRVTAEMQNMRKRYEDEISRIYKYDGESFIKKSLVILDNFERAISMDDDNLEDEVSKFLNGFKLIYNDFKKILDEAGVKEIDALDNKFDPNTMEAVLTESDKEKETGIVTSVMQKGYIYNDKVIRPAMVKVNEIINE